MLPNSAITALDTYSSTKNIEYDNSDIYFDLKWDLKKGDFVYEKGTPVLLTTKKEIVKQWIIKCLIVTKNAWRVYYKDVFPFGVGINKYRGINPLYQDYAQSEIKREILTALKEHEYIKSISNYYSDFKEDRLTFEFDVILKDEEGTLNISETFEFDNLL